jgi:hypothetical protein
MDYIKNKIKWMASINNFFLSRFKECKQILRQQPLPTHREEAPGDGVAIILIACRRAQRSPLSHG